MKKWLIRCLTVLAMVCLIPGIVLKAAAETTTVRYKNCGSVETREILGYRKYDSNSHRFYKTANGKTLNADVNGALNILRKSNIVSLEAIYARGEVDTPVRIRIA